MGDVKRYEINSNYSCSNCEPHYPWSVLEQAADGEYVKHDDYAALTKERDEMRAALEQIACEGDEENEWDGVDKFHRVRDLARAMLVDLLKAQARALAPLPTVTP